MGRTSGPQGEQSATDDQDARMVRTHSKEFDVTRLK